MSVHGIGLDILEIVRMQANIANARFMERVYTPAERAYIFSKGKSSAQTAAGLFCAKEAFMKAAGQGLAIPLQEIEVCRDSRGKPFLTLYGKTADAYRSLRSELSITHSATTAAAVVILFEEDML